MSLKTYFLSENTHFHTEYVESSVVWFYHRTVGSGRGLLGKGFNHIINMQLLCFHIKVI